MRGLDETHKRANSRGKKRNSHKLSSRIAQDIPSATLANLLSCHPWANVSHHFVVNKKPDIKVPVGIHLSTALHVEKDGGRGTPLGVMGGCHGLLWRRRSRSRRGLVRRVGIHGRRRGSGRASGVLCRVGLSRILSTLGGRRVVALRGAISNGGAVRLLDGALGRSTVVLNRGMLLNRAAALDTEDDQEDPGDEFQDTSDDEAGDTAVELAIVTAGAGVVVAVVVVVGVVGVPTTRSVGQVCADESTADDEEDHGTDEETDRPPLGHPGDILHRGTGVHWLRHGGQIEEGGFEREKEASSESNGWRR